MRNPPNVLPIRRYLGVPREGLWSELLQIGSCQGGIWERFTPIWELSFWSVLLQIGSFHFGTNHSELGAIHSNLGTPIF